MAKLKIPVREAVKNRMMKKKTEQWVSAKVPP